MGTAPARALWTPNLFGTAFGCAGVAECWTTAHAVGVVPAWPGDVSWVVAALLRLGIGVGDLGRPAARRPLRADLADPVQSPFLALVPILPMPSGPALAEYAPAVGKVVFGTALVATVALGGWLTGEWILSDTRLDQWHPGYFLPTAAGFLAAQASATLGYPSLARLMFGYALVSWLVLGSILLARLSTASALPAPLVPTVAIQVAPPVPFGPGWWAYAFSGAAVVDDGVRWLAAEHVHGRRPLTVTLLVLVTTAVALLAARTARAVSRRAYLPRAAAPAPPATPSHAGAPPPLAAQAR